MHIPQWQKCFCGLYILFTFFYHTKLIIIKFWKIVKTTISVCSEVNYYNILTQLFKPGNQIAPDLILWQAHYISHNGSMTEKARSKHQCYIPSSHLHTPTDQLLTRPRKNLVQRDHVTAAKNQYSFVKVSQSASDGPH